MKYLSSTVALSLLVPGLAYGACAPIGLAGATGGFTTSNGQILRSDGTVFQARGINVMEGNQPSAAQIQADFPGTNFVRLAIYDYASGASLAPYVTSLTNAGYVVEIEDHYNGTQNNAGGNQGVIFTGSALQTELAWDADIASTFKNNPDVWHGTNNEPAEVDYLGGPLDPAGLANWQLAEYNAIRGTGNTSPIMVEINGWGDPSSFGQGLPAPVFAGMNGIIGDIHQYGWLTNGSTDQATVNANVAANIAQTEKIQTATGSLPVIIGENGPSTTGPTPDSNGEQLITAVENSGVGSVAWAYANGSEGQDTLLNYSGGLTSFGTQVAAYNSGAIGACPTNNPIPAAPAKPAAPPIATFVPDPPPLPANLLAPLPLVSTAPTPPADQTAAPTPDLPIPPLPPVAAAPEPDPVPVPPAPAPSFVIDPAVTPVLPPVAPALIPVIPDVPSIAPDLYAPIVNAPPPPPDADPVAGWLVTNMQAATRRYGMINPIGTWLTRMDGSILTSGDAALQGMPALLTIPVTVMALIFLGGKAVDIQKGDAAALQGIGLNLIKIAVIIGLSCNMGNYDYYVRDFFYTNIPNHLSAAAAAGLTGIATGVQGVAATMDALYAEAWSWVGKAWQNAGAFGFGTQIAAWLCGLAIGGCLVAMSLVYLLARLLLMIVLVLGPVCIACSMHKETAPIFERWMGKVIALMFLQFTAVVVLVMVLTSNKYFIDQLAPMLNPAPGSTLHFALPWAGVDASPAPSGANDIQALSSMVIWFGMGAFALWSLPAIAYSIGTGVAVSFVPVLLGLMAASSAITAAASSAMGALPAFALPGGSSGGGLSMSMARDELEGSSTYDAIPPPPPPALSEASTPRLN